MVQSFIDCLKSCLKSLIWEWIDIFCQDSTKMAINYYEIANVSSILHKRQVIKTKVSQSLKKITDSTDHLNKASKLLILRHVISIETNDALRPVKSQGLYQTVVEKIFCQEFRK